MNLISDLESELAMAVLLEKRHSDKINSKDLLPLIKRLNDALESVSTKFDADKTASPSGRKVSNSFH